MTEDEALAVDSGLLYAEGYAGYPQAWGLSSLWAWAWCLDGETVVDPAATRPGTAFFGVALRPQYTRRAHAAPFHDLFVPAASHQRAPGPAPSGPYARYIIRQADWFSSGMALQCGGKTGGVYSDDGDIVGMIEDGDAVATLMRMADEHRPWCEWEEASAAGEAAGEPAWTPAEARLQSAGRTFAVLRRLDYNVWDAWLRPAAPGGEAAGVRVTCNAVSYEMALVAIFSAMGDDMPTGFGLNYLNERITPGLPGPAQA